MGKLGFPSWRYPKIAGCWKFHGQSHRSIAGWWRPGYPIMTSRTPVLERWICWSLGGLGPTIFWNSIGLSMCVCLRLFVCVWLVLCGWFACCKCLSQQMMCVLSFSAFCPCQRWLKCKDRWCSGILSFSWTRPLCHLSQLRSNVCSSERDLWVCVFCACRSPVNSNIVFMSNSWEVVFWSFFCLYNCRDIILYIGDTAKKNRD